MSQSPVSENGPRSRGCRPQTLHQNDAGQKKKNITNSNSLTIEALGQQGAVKRLNVSEGKELKRVKGCTTDFTVQNYTVEKQYKCFETNSYIYY